MNRQEQLFEQAEKLYGQRPQVIVAIEELAELQLSLIKTLLQSGIKTEDIIIGKNYDIGDFLLEAESMASSIQEKCKFFRSFKYDESKKLIPSCDMEGELADSRIMIKQMIKMFKCDEVVDHVEEQKIDRLDSRITALKKSIGEK